MKKIAAWFKNYWYFYKWPIIIAVFFLIAFAVMIPQVIGNIDYDIYVLYAGPYIFQMGEKDQMEDIFRQLMPRDYNGDGKKQVLVADMTIMTEEQLQRAMEEFSKDGKIPLVLNQYSGFHMDKPFSQEIFAGESVICLLDPSRYEQVKSRSGFLPLTEALGYKPDAAIDEYGIYLKDTEVGGYFPLFGQFPDDTILCIRRLSTASVFIGVKKAEVKYQYHLDFFKRLIEFKP